MYLFGRTFVIRNYFWVQIPEFAEVDFVDADGRPFLVVWRGKVVSNSVLYLRSLEKQDTHLALVGNETKSTWDQVLELSMHITFADAWLFADRPEQAGDSAEELYRWVRTNHPEKPIFFLLSKKAPDWDRLAADGFNLIQLYSASHLVAMCTAKFLISSHADNTLVKPKAFRHFERYFSFRFVFLGHGVIKDNISPWLNTKSIDLFMTSTLPEYQYVSGEASDFKFSTKEVKLTGLPRWDRYIEQQSKTSKPSNILIMPTWRKWLTKTQPRREMALPEVVDDFSKSNYMMSWQALINDPNLHRLAAKRRLGIRFALHPSLADGLHLFNVPSEVETIDLRQDIDFARTFAESAVFVTDFSSAAFNAAYLNIPVVYFQFDMEKVEAGEHTGTEGYYDYQKHGFGPVASVPHEVIDKLELGFSGGENPEYENRRKSTFVFQDQSNSERVYGEIVSFDRTLTIRY
jgi:CDP-glycerol glycerophosphotransferase (TagB/SpsB family)